MQPAGAPMDMDMATATANAGASLGAGALLGDLLAGSPRSTLLDDTAIRKRPQPARRARSFAVDHDLSVCVVGLGYIGLPTASLLGTKGAQVFGVDISPQVVATINEGRIHIEEPDLDLLVKSAVHGGRLKAGLVPVKSDVFILAVPTPLGADKQPDLGAVRAS